MSQRSALLVTTDAGRQQQRLQQEQNNLICTEFWSNSDFVFANGAKSDFTALRSSSQTSHNAVYLLYVQGFRTGTRSFGKHSFSEARRFVPSSRDPFLASRLAMQKRAGKKLNPWQLFGPAAVLRRHRGVFSVFHLPVRRKIWCSQSTKFSPRY